MIKKVIKKKKTNKKSTELKNKKVLNSKQTPPSEKTVVKLPTTPEKQPTQTTTNNNNKGNLFKTFINLTIILYFILRVNVIYYQNQIPWLTTGTNNLIDIIKSTLGGK
ncbi:hypothetical protein [Candidatus Phytoplasma australiense]|uniref:Uncharacterized protein n=1 Tax=Strawberry lethal yellows phytoplasma (CPA) str. NZSb11 TaxID=980422 RepID=R4RMR2_PHYAS|nr:hypothetical protein [Candidatus Phytoplasma australiense]AGL90620.1 hypothetical protein SLY_0705 [Strawberry lethal yellows phytoplasma (CPA) str. NZSb11]AGL90885.1 Hypothetical Protein SLY_0971 [Strawberry lethal yellows phytoplasma (CPA) str. NZSb11]